MPESDADRLSNPLDQQALKRAFAATYEGYRLDPWEAIQQYEEVQEISAKHPEKGSTALSSLVDPPRSRIRAWVDDDGMPDPYRGLQTVIDRGWLPDAWGDDTMTGLAAWVAFVYAGGSIQPETFRVRVTVTDDEERALVGGAARLLDIGLVEAATDPIELQPRADVSAFGRLLVALGAPVGDKNPESVGGLPAWLKAAPLPLRRDFARVYVQFRSHDRPDRDGVQVTEERNNAFRRQFVALLEDVTGRPDEIGGDRYPIYLVGDAKADLLRPPRWVGATGLGDHASA